MLDYIRKHLSAKLSIAILLMAAPIFVLSLGMLFERSRENVRSEATAHAESVLNTSMQRLRLYMNAVETATNINDWEVLEYMNTDSILRLTNRIVRLNPNVDGCSVSAEPNVFPKYGRHFSVYSIQDGDSVITVVEEEYDYFSKVWYKAPHNLGRPCWVDFYDESDSLEVTLNGMIGSYCKPLYNTDGTLVAVISTDLSLFRISKIISQEKPYPNSYFMMLGEEGRYLVHPDSTRLFSHTIFDNADPKQQADLVALGHEMAAGNKGTMAVDIDGKPCVVCYQPVQGTAWSLAIVCPEDDILASYHMLVYIILGILAIGIMSILLLVHRVVTNALSPINQLLTKTQSIIDGNMEVHIPKSQRVDVVGRLQNSFATMLQSLNFHLGSTRYAAEQAQRRNEELQQATLLVEQANKRKTTFIQNMSHQIRTPLNIIMGFSQVLRDYVAMAEATASSREIISEEEQKSIIDTLNHNTTLLNRLVSMLCDSSDMAMASDKKAYEREKVYCNDVARESIDYVKVYYPHVVFDFRTEVPDSVFLYASHLYLMRSLRELLYNAAKYSDGPRVVMSVSQTDKTIRYIIEDSGKGIAEADRDMVFEPFTKVDDLSEGLGLGLPLAKGHFRNMGGDLILDANYHNGCRFVAELPITCSQRQ